MQHQRDDDFTPGATGRRRLQPACEAEASREGGRRSPPPRSEVFRRYERPSPPTSGRQRIVCLDDLLNELVAHDVAVVEVDERDAFDRR